MNYKRADKFMVFNEDPDLTPIKVKLPSQPKLKEIVNYGRPRKDQKFERPRIPDRLQELNKSRTISLFDKALILKEDIEYYEEEIAFIQQEWDRRLNGVWYFINGKATYIPGGFYFYLCYWNVDNKNNYNRPDYRERDRKFFIFAEFCENDKNCYGFIYPKHRREGATSKVACWNFEYISRNKNSRGGIQSMTEKDAELVFQKHLVRGWRKMPFWFKPIFEGSTNPKAELSFNAPSMRVTRTNMGVDEMDDLGSVIDFMASGEGAYDGARLERYHADEIGKTITANVYKRHLVARQCMSVGTSIVGKCIYTSTAGEMTKGGGEQFKQIIEASDYHNRDDNGRTTSGLYTLFLPATEGFEGAMDEFGNSVVEDPKEPYINEKGDLVNYGAMSFLMNERKQAIENDDYDKLNESTRQYPIRLRDCFRNASDQDNFNMKIIQDQLDIYQFGNKDVTRGDFDWKNGNRDEEVIFTPKENGKFLVSMLHKNPQDANRFFNVDGIKIPSHHQAYIAGGDTFKFKTTQGGKKSLGGGAVFMRRNRSIDPDSRPVADWDTYKFVCTYLYRPKDKDIYCEDMLKMCVYYGCRMVPEINVPALMDHFNRRGYSGYLHYVMDKRTGKLRKNPGYHTGEVERESIFRLYHAYIENHGYRIQHDDLLRQLQEIDQDLGDFDLLVAGGMALLGDEDENNHFHGGEDDGGGGDDLDDFFRPRIY